MINDRPLIYTLSPLERINLIKTKQQLRQERYLKLKRQQYHVSLEHRQAQQKLIDEICANAEKPRKFKRLNEGGKQLLLTDKEESKIAPTSNNDENKQLIPIGSFRNKKRSFGQFNADFDYGDIISEENKKVTTSEFTKDNSILQISNTDKFSGNGAEGLSKAGSAKNGLSNNAFTKIAPSSGFTFAKKDLSLVKKTNADINDSISAADESTAGPIDTPSKPASKPIASTKPSTLVPSTSTTPSTITPLFGNSQALTSSDKPSLFGGATKDSGSLFSKPGTEKPSGFSFGKPAETKEPKTIQAKPSTGFSLGGLTGSKPDDQKEDQKELVKTGFSFGSSKPELTKAQDKPASSGFSFGSIKPGAKKDDEKPAITTGFSFGAPKTNSQTDSSTDSKPSSLFSLTKPTEKDTANKPSLFSFNTASKPESEEKPNQERPLSDLFSTNTKPSTESAPPTKPAFGGSGFSFGQSNTSDKKEDKPVSGNKISFGAKDGSSLLLNDKQSNGAFQFSANKPTSTDGFSFGAKPDNIKTTDNKSTPLPSLFDGSKPEGPDKSSLFGQTTDTSKANGFSFSKSTTETSKPPSSFNFGASKVNEPAKAPTFSFGGLPKSDDNKKTDAGSIFGKRTLDNEQPTEAAKPNNGFLFGAPSILNEEGPLKRSKPGLSSTASQDKPSFSFSANNGKPTGSIFGAQPTGGTSSPAPFSFSKPNGASSTGFNFGGGGADNNKPASAANGGIFSSGSPATSSFNFGATKSANSDTQSNANGGAVGAGADTGFSFGNKGAFGADSKQQGGFSFGSKSTSPAPGLNFGSSNTAGGFNNNSGSRSASPFAFGTQNSNANANNANSVFGGSSNNSNVFGGGNGNVFGGSSNNNAGNNNHSDSATPTSFNFSFGGGGAASQMPDPSSVFTPPSVGAGSASGSGGFNFGNTSVPSFGGGAGGSVNPAGVFGNGSAAPSTPLGTPGQPRRRILQPKSRLRR